MSEQIALRFPDGTKARINAAALPGETQTATILRALAAIEQGAKTQTRAVVQVDQTADLAALARRVAALEASYVVSTPATGKRKSVEERAAELKAASLNRETIYEVLSREKYQVSKVGLKRLLLTQGGTNPAEVRHLSTVTPAGNA